MTQFHKHLRSLRVSAGMSLQELSDKSGISKGHLSKLENGIRKVPSMAHLRSLSEALEMPFVFFLTSTECLTSEDIEAIKKIIL